MTVFKRVSAYATAVDKMVLSYYRRMFPERQIYHRCNGQVHFTVVSGRAQLLALGGTALVVGWVAYVSVHFLFADNINRRLAERYRDMTRQYETQLVEMRSHYDRLQSMMAVVQDKFIQEVEALEDRQRRLDVTFDMKTALLEEREKNEREIAQSVFSPPQPEPNSSSSLSRMTDWEVTPRRSRPRQGLAAVESSVDGIAAMVAGVANSISVDIDAPLPGDFETLARLEERVSWLRASQERKLTVLEERAEEEIARLETGLRRIKLPIEPLVSRIAQDSGTASDLEGKGGPFVGTGTLGEPSQSGVGGIDEEQFFDLRISRISEKFSRIAALKDTVAALPLTRPVDLYRITSWFGPRTDPFTGRRGRHNGLDIAGPSGTPIYAAADGTVIIATALKDYGKFVEIDHGNGFKTRYGHLRSIVVERGQKVDRRQLIGRMGNTGRSTGPHLHYEVRYRGVKLDPMNFLEAGRYVFED